MRVVMASNHHCMPINLHLQHDLLPSPKQLKYSMFQVLFLKVIVLVTVTSEKKINQFFSHYDITAMQYTAILHL